MPIPPRRKAALPGLVNAHSHAFQRLIRGRTQYLAPGRTSDDFWSWRESMYVAAESLDPDDLHAVCRQAFLEMALAGITTVGEFHYLHHASDGQRYQDPNLLAHRVIDAARDVGLRICLLDVAYARAGHGVAPNPRQRRFIDADLEACLLRVEALQQEFRGDDAVHVGVAPHSVRAVPRAWLKELAQLPPGMPLHMHVSEQPAEIAACLAEHRRRPVQLLQDLGLLSPRFTAVHAVHVEPDEIQALGKAGATVCACPSTERDLGDGIVPADALIAAGARLSLGSDSQAQIDLLDEARQLEGNLRLLRGRRAVLDPQGPDSNGLARRLLQIATTGGAASLGWTAEPLGEGSPLDFFTLDLDHPSLAALPDEALLPGIIFGAEKGAIRDVAVGGKQIIADGRHPLQEEILAAYARVVAKVCR